MTDPTTCQEWQEAVNLAEAYLLFDSAKQYGLVTGGPESNVERCEEILKRGRVQGIEPTLAVSGEPRSGSAVAARS